MKGKKWKKAFRSKEKLIKFAKEGAEVFVPDPKIGSACTCLYDMIIQERLRAKQGSLRKLLADEQYLLLVYATLISWGMHRMGPKGAKMKDFRHFRKSIEKNANVICTLSKYKLQGKDFDLNKIKEDLRQLFLGIDVMASGSRFVSSSKIMHFLLPELVPPMDRQYTLKFFKKWIYGNAEKEFEVFFYILGQFHDIASNLDLKKSDCGDVGFAYTVPKLIDNAIVDRQNKK